MSTSRNGRSRRAPTAPPFPNTTRGRARPRGRNRGGCSLASDRSRSRTARLVERDIAHMKAAAAAAGAKSVFMSAASPGVVVALPSEFPLQRQRRLSHRRRRGDARGIRGDRQCRLHPAARLPRSGVRPDERVLDGQRRGIRPPMPYQHRDPERRVEKRAGEPGAAASLLGQLRRPACARRAA